MWPDSGDNGWIRGRPVCNHGDGSSYYLVLKIKERCRQSTMTTKVGYQKGVWMEGTWFIETQCNCIHVDSVSCAVIMVGWLHIFKNLIKIMPLWVWIREGSVLPILIRLLTHMGGMIYDISTLRCNLDTLCDFLLRWQNRGEFIGFIRVVIYTRIRHHMKVL